MTLLRLDDLRKEFPVKGEDRPLVAVSGISLDLPAGEVLALVGESGSGKTTVGRIIVGLETATSGSVNFDGREIARLDARARRGLAREIQIVFQDPGDSLDPRKSNGDLIAEPLFSAKLSKTERRQRVVQALDHVRLERGVLDRYPHESSSGTQQKVALARALVAKPRLLVLDEPTSALDVRARLEILSIVRELRDEGLAALLISHDLTVVRGVANRVAVMYLGEIAELGSTVAVFSGPRHPYTRALLSAVPRPDPSTRQARIRLTGEIPSPIHLPRGCYLRGRCPRAIEACADIHPGLLPAPDGHLVACIREQEESDYYDPDEPATEPAARGALPTASNPRGGDE